MQQNESCNQWFIFPKSQGKYKKLKGISQQKAIQIFEYNWKRQIWKNLKSKNKEEQEIIFIKRNVKKKVLFQFQMRIFLRIYASSFFCQYVVSILGQRQFIFDYRFIDLW
ncbi:unnamed protein product [Paramecium sonneborni]|uniref:Transmembrane protein n=1 Tax=Paramecium sonneborni TaxID=65129 RepID=A0A8S1PCW3_9CILI|nr:unnamed protein product [Paramecium sonneborni]